MYASIEVFALPCGPDRCCLQQSSSRIIQEIATYYLSRVISLDQSRIGKLSLMTTMTDKTDLCTADQQALILGHNPLLPHVRDCRSVTLSMFLAPTWSL